MYSLFYRIASHPLLNSIRQKLPRWPSVYPGQFLFPAVLSLAGSVLAQSPESDLAPDYKPPSVVEAPAIPELSDSSLAAQNIDNRHFTMNWGLAILMDYTGFSQDDASVAQVGVQEDQAEVRDFRFILRGDLKFLGSWNYLAAAAYKGFGQNDGDDDWALNDLFLAHTLWSPQAKLGFGKTKEPFSYELVGDSANLPQQERLLSPFFVSRNWGVKISDVLPGQRATWSAGVFNDGFLDDATSSGTDLAARVTMLPMWLDDGRRFLHLAASGRYYGGDDNTLRFRGRPESNVSDYFVDTGNLAADHAWQLGFEALWSEGPFSLLAEYVRADVSSGADGGAVLSGWYLSGSWVLTGEARPYDRTVGYARRVLPTKRWGAPELVVRLARTDLDDGNVAGGTMSNVHFGINWWATKRWKAGFSWTHTRLKRDGLEGSTDSFLTRLQWIH